jgi:signal transduction histidine kinase
VELYGRQFEDHPHLSASLEPVKLATIRISRGAGIPRDVLLIGFCLVVDLALWAGDRDLSVGGRAPFWLVPVMAVPVMCLLAKRKTWPVAVFPCQCAYACISILIPRYQPIAGLLVACYTVAARRPRGVALPLIFVAGIPIAVDTLATAWSFGQTVGQALATASISVLLVIVATALGSFAFASSKRAAMLEQENAARATEALRHERLRLARELHDIVAHSVSVMLLQAAGAKKLASRQDSALMQPLGVIQDVGVQAMNELHRMLNVLRAAASEDEAVERSPGLEDLPRLLELSGMSGLRVHHEVEGIPRRLDTSVDLAGYRVIQEGLTNASKHAGPTATVDIRQRWSDDSLSITVTSAGRSQPVEAGSRHLSGGFGLQGLRERVAVVGGTFSAGPSAAGFTVRARLPLTTSQGVVEMTQE